MAKVILVVDNEANHRAIITSMLVSAGYVCLEATNGLEALSVLNSGKEVDLITSALLMPELDGIGLLEQVKERYPRVPFVVLCAVHDNAVADAEISRGARYYLQKPFGRDELLSVVDRELGVHRPRPRVASPWPQVVEMLDSIQKDASEIRGSVEAIEKDVSLQTIREALDGIQEEIRTMPEKVFERLEEKKLILDITTLPEMLAKDPPPLRYSFAVTNRPEPDYRGGWVWLFVILSSIPFWLAALYLLVRFVKWAWVR